MQPFSRCGRNPQRRVAVRVRLPRREIPILTPGLITDLLDAEAVPSPQRRRMARRPSLPQCNSAADAPTATNALASMKT
jgi:hypothetical protein